MADPFSLTVGVNAWPLLRYKVSMKSQSLLNQLKMSQK